MTFVAKHIGWLALGAVALVFAFVLGMLAGRNDEGTIPVPADIGPVVKHGVAAVMICGNWPASKGLGLSKAGMGNGMWVPAPRQDDCQVWYHQPPHPDEEWYREGTGGSPTSGPA
jgi:hypothetical protein